VRRTICAVLMMTMLLLTSCKAADKTLRDALTFREILQEHGGASFTASITTEVDSRTYAFTLASVYTCGGTAELTVLAPDSISGIQASLTALDATMSFEGAALDFGTLCETMTSPLYAPFVFGRCWEEGYIDSAGKDGEAYRVTYRLGYEHDELILETWFSSGVPVRCELYQGETLLLRADVESYTFL